MKPKKYEQEYLVRNKRTCRIVYSGMLSECNDYILTSENPSDFYLQPSMYKVCKEDLK